MTRTLKVSSLATGLIGAVLVFYLVWLRPPTHESSRKVEKGNRDSPSNAGALAGQYYTGDGLGYNINLTLKPEGTYEAEWRGCLGIYGTAAGRWSLIATHIVFTPSNETVRMRESLTNLNIMKFRGNWIFLSMDDVYQKYYEEFGVDRFSCFQNTGNIFGR